MSDFPAGFAIVHDEQTYRPVSIRPHTNRDGAESWVIEWATSCPGCSVEFSFLMGRTFNTGRTRRYCDACKAPGRTVKNDRKLFRRQISGEAP